MNKTILFTMIFTIMLVTSVSAQVTISGPTTGSTDKVIDLVSSIDAVTNDTIGSVNSSNYWGNYFFEDYDMPTIKIFGYNQTAGANGYADGNFVPYVGATDDVRIGDQNIYFNETNDLLGGSPSTGGISFHQDYPQAKGGIWWESYDPFSDKTRISAWITSHYNSSNGNNHQHFSIETLDNSTGSPSINSHFAIEYGSNVSEPRVTFPGAYVSDMKVDNIYSRGLDNIDYFPDLSVRFFPQGQSTRAIGFTDDGSEPQIQALGTDSLEFLDSINSTGKICDSVGCIGDASSFGDVFVNETGDTMTGQLIIQSGNGKIVSSNAGGSASFQTTTGQPGYISFGNTADIGISTDGVVGTYDYDGGLIFKQKASNPDETGEFIFIEESGDWRFALPSSGAGLGTYNPRSFIIAGPSKNNASNFVCGDWGFDNIDCDTSGTGADLGIQDDLQVKGTIFANTNISLQDNDKIFFGDSYDSSIYYDSSATALRIIDDNIILGDGTDDQVLTFDGDTDGVITWFGDSAVSPTDYFKISDAVQMDSAVYFGAHEDILGPGNKYIAEGAIARLDLAGSNDAGNMVYRFENQGGTGVVVALKDTGANANLMSWDSADDPRHLGMIPAASYQIWAFEDSTSGETKDFRIYGFPVGGSSTHLELRIDELNDAIYNLSSTGTHKFYTDNSTLTAWFQNNISATGYITRTSTYDNRRGSALDFIQTGRDRRDGRQDTGAVNHSAFPDFQRAEYYVSIANGTEEMYFFDEEENSTRWENVTTYTQILEEGIILDEQIATHEEAIFELNQLIIAQQDEITLMKSELCRAGGSAYAWC